jgi:4-hydroxybenzoate polyprenyltransferase
MKNDLTPLRELAIFIRLDALAPTVYLALLGALSSEHAPDASALALVAVVGVLAHLVGYITNDLMDLRFDRFHPRRRSSPLVRGRVSVRSAAVVAVTSAIAATALTVAFASDATIWLLGHLLGGLVYNGLHKRVIGQPLYDLVQGVSWGLLMVYGAQVAQSPSSITVGIASYLVAYTAVQSGVIADLYDLSADIRAAARSTARVLGADAATAGLRVPRTIWRYAIAWQLAGAAALVWTAMRTVSPTLPRVLTTAAVLAGEGLALWVLTRFLADIAAGRKRSRDENIAHLLLGLLLPALVVVPHAPLATVVLVVATLVLPWAWVWRQLGATARRLSRSLQPGAPH